MILHRRTPMTLVRWNAARELASMEIDRLNQMFADFYGTGRAWAPAVDIYETSDREYVIKADLPEMKREDIHLTFENSVLTLSGQRPSASVDGNRISAAYKDGVLTVRIPQREEAKPKQIEVSEQ